MTATEALEIVVAPATTTTAITASQATIATGQPETYTATVSLPGGPDRHGRLHRWDDAHHHLPERRPYRHGPLHGHLHRHLPECRTPFGDRHLLR